MSSALLANVKLLPHPVLDLGLHMQDGLWCAVLRHSVLSDSLWPCRLQPTRHLCPWNSPGKNTGVGCHALLQETIPIQGSNQVSSIAGRLFTIWNTREAQILEQVAFPISRGSFQPRNGTRISCTADRFFTSWATREVDKMGDDSLIELSWCNNWGFPGDSCGKESTCQWRRRKRRGFNPQVRRIPWRRKWQPIPIYLPGKVHGQRSLMGYSPWGCKE